MDFDDNSIHNYPQIITVPQRAILKSHVPPYDTSVGLFSQPVSGYQSTLAIISPNPWTTGAIPSSLRTTASTLSHPLPSSSTSSAPYNPDDDSQVYPHLENKPPTADIAYYFNNKNSILYDKRTRKLKERAPNAFMLYRLSQIKDLKGKRHSPTFINNTISNGWALLPLEDKGYYTDLSHLLQTRLDAIHKQSGKPPRARKSKQPDTMNNIEPETPAPPEYIPGLCSYSFQVERNGSISVVPVYSAATPNPILPNLVECVSDEADCGIQFLA